MRIRVVPATTTRRSIPTPRELAADYDAPAPGALAGAPRRAIALVERELDGEPNMLTMRELEIAGDGRTGPLVTVSEGEETRRYRSVAAHFEDATTFFPMLGHYEVWQLINLTGDTHPIHLHLDPFQILSRRPIRWEIPEGGIGDRRPLRCRHARTRPRRPARPRDRRQRTRSQRHDPRQPQRDRRDRSPLHELQRPVHVPLPHPRARGPRHDAALRHDAAELMPFMP